MQRTVKAECSECSGTGLYCGMGERDGVAIVCSRCSGTGVAEITYTVPEGKKKRSGVKRVLRYNPGICVGGPNLENLGGMSYEDWAAGKPFPEKSELRKFTCPAWWYQGVDYTKKPAWDKCGELGCLFSECEHFKNKDRCWERWDGEHPNG